jgi:division protein CdvB (Snf7/Vps24/ESCRT-III family)
MKTIILHVHYHGDASVGMAPRRARVTVEDDSLDRQELEQIVEFLGAFYETRDVKTDIQAQLDELSEQIDDVSMDIQAQEAAKKVTMDHGAIPDMNTELFRLYDKRDKLKAKYHELSKTK